MVADQYNDLSDDGLFKARLQDIIVRCGFIISNKHHVRHQAIAYVQIDIANGQHDL